MKTSFAWFLLTLGLSAPGEDKVAWKHRNDVDSALTEAAKSGELVAVHFWSEWCLWSRDLRDQTHSDSAVARTLEKRFIAVTINKDQCKAIAERFRVQATPETVFLRGDGKVVTRLLGFLPPRIYRHKLTQIADAAPAIAEDERRRATLEPAGAGAELDARLLGRYVDIEAWETARPLAERLAASSVTHLALGMSALEGGGMDAALENFRKGLAADPDNASGRAEALYRGKARVEMARQETAAALATCTEAIERFPRSEEIHWWWFSRGLAHFRLKQYPETFEAACMALDGYPDDSLRPRIQELWDAAAARLEKSQRELVLAFAEKRRREQEARLKPAEEGRFKTEMEARLKAEEESRLLALENARLKAEAEARLKAAAEAEAKRKAEEEERLKTTAESRLKAEAEARLKTAAEAEARRKAEEEARLLALENARLKAEAEARPKTAAVSTRTAEEEARLDAEAEARIKAAADAAAGRVASGEARAKAEADAAARRLVEERDSRKIRIGLSGFVLLAALAAAFVLVRRLRAD